MHRYKVRPGYGSQKLLSEFGTDTSDEVLWDDIVGVLKDAGARPVGTADLIVDICVAFECDAGRFEMHHDEWGFFWCHADSHQEAIAFVDSALARSDDFTKIEVDPSEYARPAE